MVRSSSRKRRQRGVSRQESGALIHADLFSDAKDEVFVPSGDWAGVIVTGGDEKLFQLSHGISDSVAKKLHSSKRRGEVHWSHTWYRNAQGQPLQVSYASNLKESEKLAQRFLKESVVGFDMEWMFSFGKTFSGIKNNISLIQVASESEIGLFQIALHSGKTVRELLAPSLRKIIESDSIIKAGVAIHNADGKRLQQWMKIKPRGLFELSHLYRLVKYSEKLPGECNRKLVGLSAQVEEHLGFPLFKGSVRTSDWSKPLNQEQMNYAASDAYAGLLLFHVMEAKRLKLTPAPPRPHNAELGLPIRLAEPKASEENLEKGESNDEEGEIPDSDTKVGGSGRYAGFKIVPPSDMEERAVLAEASSSPQNDRKRRNSVHDQESPSKRTRVSRASKYEGWRSLTTDEQTLFEALYENRTKVVDEGMSSGNKISAFIVAHNATLANMARLQPTTLANLLQVPFIGSRKAALYGDEWLKIISAHVTSRISIISLDQRNPAMAAGMLIHSDLERSQNEAISRPRPQLPPLPKNPMLQAPPEIIVLDPNSSPAAFEPIPSPTKIPRQTHSPSRTAMPGPPNSYAFNQTQRTPQNSQAVDPSQRRLLSALTALRVRLSRLTNKDPQEISSDAALKAIATRQPTTIAEVCRIPGAGKLIIATKSKQIDLLAFLDRHCSIAGTQQSHTPESLSSAPTQSQSGGMIALEEVTPEAEAQLKELFRSWVDIGIESAIAELNVQSSGVYG